MTRAYACDGCGDRLPTRHACISPSGEHTPRPLPEVRESGESAARTENTETPAARIVVASMSIRQTGPGSFVLEADTATELATQGLRACCGKPSAEHCR